jgi:hypothetical protein
MVLSIDPALEELMEAGQAPGLRSQHLHLFELRLQRDVAVVLALLESGMIHLIHEPI